MLVPERRRTMFTRMLVPLDGSDRAERAVPVAARLARAAHGTVILVQITEPPTNFLMQGEYFSQISMADLIEEGQARASNYLDDIRKRPELAELSTEIRVEFGE